MHHLQRVSRFAMACGFLIAATGLFPQDALHITPGGNFGKGEGESKAVFAAGSLVYYAVGEKLQIASFSNPASPLKVASVGLPNIIEDLVRTSINSVQHLVVVGGPKMWLINVQNPTTPSVVATVNIGSTCEGLATSGTNAYVAAGGLGLQIYNISNPASPTFVASIDTLDYCESVVISAPYAYIAAASRSYIVNISNPATPVVAGQYLARTDGYHQYAGIRSGHLYVCDFNLGLDVVNVTNPASPSFATTLQTGFRTARITFDGNYGYIANGDSGMRIIDVSSIAAPVEVALHDTPGRAASVYFGAITINATPTGHIYVADRTAGLRAINVSNPAAPSESGAINIVAPASGTAYTSFVLDNKAYVAYGTAGLRIIDVANPNNPVLLGTIDTPGDARAVVVGNNHAYVADRDSGVRVIDVSNPNQPVEVNNVATPRARGIAISGDYVYVAASDSGLVVLNIAVPASPVWLKSVPALYGENVAAWGNIAGITDYGKIRFYDVTNPANPVHGGETASFSTGNEGFAIAGNYAHVPDGDKLLVYDISNLATPAQVGSVTHGGYSYLASIDGEYAYVAAEGAGLRVIDVSDPTNPQEVAYYDGPSDARGVVALNGYAYVTERADGLTIYHNDLVTAVQEDRNQIPGRFALHQNYPNPFNPSTKIQFELSRPSPVKLEIQNLLGQTVAVLVNEPRAAGSHTVIFHAEKLGNGVYVYRLEAEGNVQVRKLVLMK